MKLACDACGSKYSIGDERVAGKVFKVRCRKCSNLIIVRGSVVEAPIAEPAAQSDAWYAMVDGSQVGPFDVTEVARRRDAGTLDDDSYLWREGMADWAVLGAIDGLRRGAPAEPEATRMHGERNESSVLFTLANLAKLAAPAPLPAAGTPSEGSGLIDIRALAATLAPAAKQASGSLADLPTYAATAGAEPIVLAPIGRAPHDRRLILAIGVLGGLLLIIAATLVFVVLRAGPPAVASVPAAIANPVTASIESPGARSDEKRRGEVIESAGAAGAHHDEPSVTQPADTTAPTITTPHATAVTAPTPHPTVTTSPTGTTPHATAVTSPTATTPHATPRSNAVTNPSAPVRPASHAQLRLTPADAADDRCGEIPCAVGGYAEKCCERYRTAAPVPRAALPEDLDRDALKAGIATIKAQACSGKSSTPGSVAVSIRVAPSGAVADVVIKSSPDPALSACVIAAAQHGTFAATKRGNHFAYAWRF